MLALGAVTEPFLEVTKDKTFDYLKELGKLQNPIQISTKVTLTQDDCRRIREYTPNISVLVTIVCLRDYKKIEPNAPSPIDRIETMEKLVKEGLHTSLFLRPIIPGLSDRDAEDLLKMCLSVGVKTVVLGTLRVTKNIYLKLRSVGIDLTPRIVKLSDKEQIPIKASDLKKRIAKLAEKLGFTVYEAACGANIEASKLGCVACDWGPCGYPENIPNVDDRDVLEFMKYLGYSGKCKVTDREVKIELNRGDAKRLKVLLKELTRRKIQIKTS